MTAIGFIGLGIMGSHMAANLVRASHSVTGYDVVPAAVDRVAQAGGKPAADIADAVNGAEVVITMCRTRRRSRRSCSGRVACSPRFSPAYC